MKKCLLLCHLETQPEPEPAQDDVSSSAVACLLAIYFCASVLVFGISVPAGNFIPAMTIGAALGRLFGHLLADAGHVERANVGRFALMGAGAVLCGVTRMTLTLAAILVEA